MNISLRCLIHLNLPPFFLRVSQISPIGRYRKQKLLRVIDRLKSILLINRPIIDTQRYPFLPIIRINLTIHKFMWFLSTEPILPTFTKTPTPITITITITSLTHQIYRLITILLLHIRHTIIHKLLRTEHLQVSKPCIRTCLLVLGEIVFLVFVFGVFVVIVDYYAFVVAYYDGLVGEG